MAPKKRGKPKKISPPKVVKQEVIDTAPFHVIFPITLVHKDGVTTKTCYFQHESHLKKYIQRHQLKKSECKISNTEPRIKNEEV